MVTTLNDLIRQRARRGIAVVNTPTPTNPAPSAGDANGGAGTIAPTPEAVRVLDATIRRRLRGER